MINHSKVVLVIICHQAGSALGVEIGLMKRSLRSLTSIIKNTKNIRSTRTKRSTKSITHPSPRRGKVQKNAKVPKRENQARIGVVREDIIIAVRETSNHLEVVATCNLLLRPNMRDVKDTSLVTNRVTVALVFHQIEATEEMSLEEVDFLHHVNLNLLHTNMGELNMKKAKIATMIATIKVVEVIMTAADLAVAIQSSNSSRTSQQRNSAGSLIFVSRI